MLVSDGFVHGYQRLWQTSNEAQIIVFLYQFRTTGGAASYLQQTSANNEADRKPRVPVPGVLGIPGAIGLSTTSQGHHRGENVVFTKGGYLVQIATVGPSTTPSPPSKRSPSNSPRPNTAAFTPGISGFRPQAAMSEKAKPQELEPREERHVQVAAMLMGSCTMGSVNRRPATGCTRCIRFRFSRPSP